MNEFEQQYTYLIGITVSLICAIGYSTIAVASRRLKSIHYAVIQFTYGLFASIAMGIYLIAGCISARHIPYLYDEWQVYFMILLCAFLNMVSQNLTTYCNQYSNPGTLGIYMYMGVAYNFAADLLIFDIEFVKLQVIGVAISLTFSITAALYKIHLQKKSEIEEKRIQNLNLSIATDDYISAR